MLEMLVGVLDHDDDGIHHGTDGDGDAAEGHDVGADALAVHHQQGHQHGHGQDKDGHQRAPEMQQKRQADQGHNETFLDQFFLERLDGMINEVGAIVVDRHFHIRRQGFHGLLQPGFGVLDDLMSVGTVADHDDAADGFALAVGLGDAAPHVRAELDGGHVAQQHGHSPLTHADGHFFEIVEAGDVAFDAQDEFTLGQLQGAAADLAVAALDGGADILQRQVIGAQLGGIHRHLVLLHEAAHAGDLRHARDRGELIFQIPVLHGAQLGQVAVG